ncbi:hypothetical protein [Enterovibrio norvegicus]|uniref:hypothetical protein n=1 Tax=Enterovibrio norvegicus TaxID=188144 RepID=UPI00352C4B25
MNSKTVSHISVKPKEIGDQKRSNEPSIIRGAVDESDGSYLCNLTDLLEFLGGQLQLDATDAYYDAKVRFDPSNSQCVLDIYEIFRRPSSNLSNADDKVKFNIHYVDGKNAPSLISASWHELVWSALMVGKSNLSALAKIDPEYTKLYDLKMRAFMLRALLAVSDGHAVKSKAFEKMEASEKVNGSFWLGMFMAKLIAAKKMNCHFLTHVQEALSDNRIDHLFKNGTTKRPDLIGFLPSQRKLLFVEAKGTSGVKRKKTINQAIEQLDVITANKSIDKKVAYSCFKSRHKGSDQSDQLVIYTIDYKSNVQKQSSNSVELKQLMEQYYKQVKGLTSKAIWQLEQIGIYLRFSETLKRYLYAEEEDALEQLLETLTQAEGTFPSNQELASEGYKMFGDGIAIKLDEKFWPVK